MIVIYNIVQIALLLILSPFIIVFGGAKKKYRDRIPKRLGFGLFGAIKGLKQGPRIWIHALSVGEAASAKPLVRSIKNDMPGAVIIFSTTTSGGGKYAKQMSQQVDAFVPFPFDVYWCVKYFIKILSPDLFILIETDFWPNLLGQLQKNKVPCLLANGRITKQSFARYQRFKLFTVPMFNNFSAISMQMTADADRLIALGINKDKVFQCGNLKYDIKTTSSMVNVEMVLEVVGCVKSSDSLGEHLLLVAGSTHRGEEEIILKAFADLRIKHKEISLIIAPRDIERGKDILGLVEEAGFIGRRRSQLTGQGVEEGEVKVLVLDTLGELAALYESADIAFVGGSLVCQGGHNPLEAAVHEKPVLFGPHMEDFAEISYALLMAGAAKSVSSENLTLTLHELIENKKTRMEMGSNGALLLRDHQGASVRYVELIKKLFTGTYQNL